MKKIKVVRNDIEREIETTELVADTYKIITDREKTDVTKLIDIFKLLNGNKIQVSCSLLKPFRDLEIFLYIESVRQDLLEMGRNVNMALLYDAAVSSFKVSIRTVQRAYDKYFKK